MKRASPYAALFVMAALTAVATRSADARDPRWFPGRVMDLASNRFSIETIVDLNGAPININQTAQINIARIVIMGADPTAFIAQTGVQDVVDLIEIGSMSSSAVVEQTGLTNITNIYQSSPSNLALLSQSGQRNSGGIMQFGAFNAAIASQRP